MIRTTVTRVTRGLWVKGWSVAGQWILHRFILRVTDEKWEQVREQVPESVVDEDGCRRVPSRTVLDAVLWILNTGAPWSALPDDYPNDRLVRRCFEAWCGAKGLRDALARLANSLREQEWIGVSAWLLDIAVAAATAGRERLGLARRGKGTRIVEIAEREQMQAAVLAGAAEHREVTVVRLSSAFYMVEARRGSDDPASAAIMSSRAGGPSE